MITAAELFDYLNILRPAWVTGTVYQKGAYVTDNGTVYECTVGHTAGATFAGDAAYWTATHYVQACTDHGINSINQFCNRDFRNSAYTEYYTPDHSDKAYLLNNPPGTALTSIKYFDDDTHDYVDIFEGSDTISNSARLVNGSVILYNGYTFESGKEYQIVYTGGFATIPEKVKGACKQMGALMFKSQSRLGLSSKNIGGASDKGEGYDNDASAKILESVTSYKIYNI